MQNIRLRGLALAATGAVAVLATGSASAQNVSVTLNGSPVNLVPAPISRAGRVFVPLRGVFEKLGASVVYAGGTINAQGNGRSVALRIGSTQATVDGQAQALDVAPFIVGASTYVPLRFVSQALGATVNYDGSSHVVALTRDGGGANMPASTITPQPAAGQPAKSALT
ncbi:MAG: copper amine oxidase N-terminal domain-containing protein, partial [Candidatus Eremiobacteraeota bacterium]|nr:copper amine oxidase N-terminal domain-containing protein [Candidatus Eremiobacteraeota bacterium]